MTRRISIPSALVAAVALLSGCAGTNNTPATAATPVTSAAVSSSSPAPEPSQTTPAVAPSPTGPTAHPLGTSVTLSDNAATVTVYAYKQPVATGAPRPSQHGYTWAAAEVKVCVNQDSVVNNIPWTLVYADDTTADPSNIGYRQFPLPSYAWGDTNLNKGRCLRGWIVFEAPTSKRPTMVEYQPEDGGTYDWKA